MVITIRGTSGSGKSTVVRRVGELLGDEWEPTYVEKRRKPLYYSVPRYRLIIAGHYESQCGGCDTISGNELLYGMLRTWSQEGYIVLAEGILLSEDTKWTLRLHEKDRVRVRCAYLHVDIETCLERIRERRRKRGNDKPLNEKNTRNRFRVIERGREKLESAGILCRSLSNEQAPRVIVKWIRRYNQEVLRG